MTLEGHVENGHIVMDEAATLPEGAKVRIELLTNPNPSQPARGGFQKWLSQLDGLSQLRDGWDSYQAPAPTGNAVAAARLYLSTLQSVGWEPTRVEASVMGGVGI